MRETAIQLARTVLPYDRTAQVRAIFGFLQEHVRFVPDPLEHEYVRTPFDLLAEIRDRYYVMADCDDVAVLGAALGGAIGLPSRFVVLGFLTPDAPMGHVYAELADGFGWLDLDTTRQQTEFQRVASVSRQWVVPVFG